jgi:hypothetical protein
MGSELPRPEAVLDVSARQNLPAASVTAMPAPRTIHNYGGFPGELGEVMYPARCDPAPARCVQMLLKPVRIGLHGPLGLDHGTRSVRFTYTRAAMRFSFKGFEVRCFSMLIVQNGCFLSPRIRIGTIIIPFFNLRYRFMATAGKISLTIQQRRIFCSPEKCLIFSREIFSLFLHRRLSFDVADLTENKGEEQCRPLEEIRRSNSY